MPVLARLDLSRLSVIDMFAGITPDGVNAIAEAAQAEHYEKDEQIFDQGGRASRAYALMDGSVRIVQTGSDGGQAIIRFIAAGQVFGTVPLFTDHVFPADAVAAAPCLVLSWSEDAMMALIESHPRIAINVIAIIGARLAEVQARVRELATQRVERRIARTLLRLAAQAGNDVQGDTTIKIPLRRKDIAEIAGATLHTVSRTLAAWQKAGLLESHERRVTIHDLSTLGRIADDSP